MQLNCRNYIFLLIIYKLFFFVLASLLFAFHLAMSYSIPEPSCYGVWRLEKLLVT